MQTLKAIFVLLALLVSPQAEGSEVLFPVIDLDVGNSARAERHPTVREGMVEVVIRGCYEDLGAVLTGRTNPYVNGMDATYSGSGVWIVKAMMSRRDADLRVQVADGKLTIDVVETVAADVEEDSDLASVRALVEGTAESPPSVTEFPPLMFLNGGAMSYSMTSSDFIPLLPAP